MIALLRPVVRAGGLRRAVLCMPTMPSQRRRHRLLPPIACASGTAQSELGEQDECGNAIEVAHVYARYPRDVTAAVGVTPAACQAMPDALR
jgi:hypothetical protein